MACSTRSRGSVRNLPASFEHSITRRHSVTTAVTKPARSRCVAEHGREPPRPGRPLCLIEEVHCLVLSSGDPDSTLGAARRVASMSSMGLFALIGEVDMMSAPDLSGLQEPIGEAIGLAL